MRKGTAGGGLDEYGRKRDFTRTPEPGPEAAALGSEAPRFMVHKHHARRLHYDLRLEIEGALASWAVPKGPSLDPEVKRLAVQTEDHPLAYGDFEGRIPDGQYGAGDSLVWDRGHFETVPPGQAAAMRRKGHLHFALFGEKLRGEWHLLRTTAPDGSRAHQGDAKGSGPRSQWLLVKANDAAADPALDLVAARPESVLTGRRETRGPAPSFHGAGGAAAKPSMPELLASGVLGSAPQAERARRPTPLFARVPLEKLPVDMTRPQELLELPAHLFGEAAPKRVAAPSALPAELFFLLEAGAPARGRTLGPIAEVALVMRELFAALSLQPLACAAGPSSLLLRVPIAPAPAPGALERFAEQVARTLAAQVEVVREGRVKIDLSLNRGGAGAARDAAGEPLAAAPNEPPKLLEPLASSPRMVCAPIDWDALAPELSLAKFTPRWLAAHRAAAEAQVAAHHAAAAPLPRAR